MAISVGDKIPDVKLMTMTAEGPRPVQSGEVLGDEVLIHAGLAAGDRVAASGSFKLRDGAPVAVSGDPAAGPDAAR